MIALLDPKTWLAAVLVAGISGGFGYWRGNATGQSAVQAKWDKAKAEAAAAVAQAKEQDIDKGQQASTAYQEQITHEKAKLRVVRQVVTRTVAGQCFDVDGLRHLNEAIRPVSAASASR